MLHGITLMTNGGVFLIKKNILLSCILLSGCTINNLDDLSSSYFVLKDKLTTSYIDIDNIDLSSKSSYAIAQFNKEDEMSAFMISASDNKEVWRTKNNVYLTIKNGKITNTRGFKYDFSIIYTEEFLEFNKKYSGYIKFDSPESSYLEIISSFNTVEQGFITLNSIQKNVEYRLIEESFNVPLIKWKDKNYYWINNDGKVFKIKQSLSPFKDSINLEFIKKNSG